MYRLYLVSRRVTYPNSIATQEVTKLALIYRGSDIFKRIILSSVDDLRAKLDDTQRYRENRPSFTRSSRSGQPCLFICSPLRAHCGQKFPCGIPFFQTHSALTESTTRPPAFLTKNLSEKWWVFGPSLDIFSGRMAVTLSRRKCLFEQSRHSV